MATVVFAGCTGGMGSLLFHQLNANAMEGSAQQSVAQRKSAVPMLGKPIRHLICVDYFRDEAAQKALRAKCNPGIVRVDTFHWDAASSASTEALVQAMDDALRTNASGIDLVIVTTGMGFHGTLASMTIAGSSQILNKLLQVNAVGPSLLLQYCAKRMRIPPATSSGAVTQQQPGPPVVFNPTMLVLSSYSGLIGLPHRAAYCASKFALNGFIESLAAEYPAIRYVVVCPTSVATDFRDNWKKQLATTAPAGAPVEVNAAQLTAEQCVAGIWKALGQGRSAPGVAFVVLPGGKTDLAAVCVRMPWGIGNFIRQRVYRQAKL